MQKRRNELIRDDFLSIIQNPGQEHMIENAGFIRDGLETRTYLQTKRGLNYWYVKRKVLDDGVTTTHLDIQKSVFYMKKYNSGHRRLRRRDCDGGRQMLLFFSVVFT